MCSVWLKFYYEVYIVTFSLYRILGLSGKVGFVDCLSLFRLSSSEELEQLHLNWVSVVCHYHGMLKYITACDVIHGVTSEKADVIATEK